MSDFDPYDTPLCSALNSSPKKKYDWEAWQALAFKLEDKLRQANEKIEELESHFPAL